MTLIPRHPASRVAAALWLLACLSFLVLTLLQDGLYADERSALAMMVPVYFLSLPCGHIALMLAAKIKLALYLSAEFSPSILAESVFVWTFTVAIGYVQWFMLLPWLTRKCWQFCRVLANRRGTGIFD
jgi:hypothetical protein